MKLSPDHFALHFEKQFHECSILDNEEIEKDSFLCRSKEMCISSCDENPDCNQVVFNTDTSLCTMRSKAFQMSEYSSNHVSAQCVSNTVVPSQNEDHVESGLKHATLLKLGDSRDGFELGLNPVGQLQANIFTDDMVRNGHKFVCSFDQFHADQLLRQYGRQKCLDACHWGKDVNTRCVETPVKTLRGWFHAWK